MENECLITIIAPVTVIRDSDHLKIKLVPYNQYCFIEKGMYIDLSESIIAECKREATPCKKQGYKVESDDSFYIVFDNTAVVEGFARDGLDLLGLDDRARQEQLDMIPKDHKKETLKNLGIDIKAGEKTDYNGEWLQKALEKRGIE